MTLDDEVLKAKKKAMLLLQHRDRTEWELRNKLEMAGFSQEAAEEAMEYVRSFHYIDDTRYACRFVEIYHSSRSVQRMRQDLQKKHIPDELIALAMEEISYDDSPALEKALNQVLHGKTRDELTYEERQKIMAKLYRKGFRPDQIRKCLEN